ncbi:hypothetical protein ACFQL1_13050 [Halomicroarcula sp. GCM10025709]|uniref:hypothetical protein n=1 Tax=Haloarcula TaxID=2237 RepID=UPI0024C381DC|nr:hypothetical protein [Halomicroarcula sp. YJ-61-S]
MGRRTLVVRPISHGRVAVRVAHWGVGADPVAQSRPLATDRAASAVWTDLDATYDRVVVVDGGVRSYCVCWLDPTLADPGDVALATTADLDALRAWWVETKSRACRDRRRSPSVVRSGLLRALDRRARTALPPDDTPFLSRDR